MQQNQTISRSIWWKVYFFFITLISILGLASYFSDPQHGWPEYISLIVWVVSTAGLFGYVFLKPTLTPKFWLSIFSINIVLALGYSFITKIDLQAGLTVTEFYISTAIGFALSLPAYYSLYALSKPTNSIWQNV